MQADTRKLVHIIKRTVKFFISLLEKWERGEKV
jgi:hypothetical protein